MFFARVGLFSLIFHSLWGQFIAGELETQLCFVYSKDEFGLNRRVISAEYCFTYYQECCDEGCCVKSDDESDSTGSNVALGIAIVLAVLRLLWYLCSNNGPFGESVPNTSNSRGLFRRSNTTPNVENGENTTEIVSDTVRLNITDPGPSTAGLSTPPITPPPSYDSVLPSYEDVMKDKIKP